VKRALKIEALFKKIRFNGKPKLIDLTAQTLLPETLREYKSLCTDEDKMIYLYHFLRNHSKESVIVFTNTIPVAKRVNSLLNLLKLKSLCLHSEMQQRQRLRKLEQFYNRDCSIIVCTDVASRGLDIPEVQNVIHYQIPRDMDTYVHRSGRTARIGKEGVAYALIGPGDKNNYVTICKYLCREQGIQDIALSLKEIDQLKEYTHIAEKVEKGEFQIKKKKKEKEWYTLNAEKADIALDYEIEEEIENLEEEMTIKKKVLVNDRRSYSKAQLKVDKFNDEFKRKSVFLDPGRIAELNVIMLKAQAYPKDFKKKKDYPGPERQIKHKFKKRKF